MSMRPVLFAVAMIAAASVLAGADAKAQSTICPAASAGRPAGSGARTLIPLPDRGLLAPPAQFNCETKATSGDETQGDPDAARRMKFDDERQCYREAEKSLRDRLLLVVAAADETIKAVAECVPASMGSSAKPGARASIPLPAQALLAPPAEVDCEAEATRRDETVKAFDKWIAGTRGQSPTPAQADPDAALRAKLDYERQCHRDAEKMLRSRLLELQAAVGETIEFVNRGEAPKFVNRGEAPAPNQQRRLDPKLVRALQAGGLVIVHRYTGRIPGSSPPAAADTIDAGQRISPQGRADAQAMGEVYRRLKIPVSQVLSSEFFVVYQTATAAFGNRVVLGRDLTGSRYFNDPAELAQSLSRLRSRVATPPPAGTNTVLWTHEGKFKKAFGHSLSPGATAVFAPRKDGVPHEMARLSLKEFLALAD